MKKISLLLFVIFVFVSIPEVKAQEEPFIGEIKMFAGNFAPRGFAFCDGQLLSISQNTALFAILGTIYGGDGRTSFGLPDLRGRVPVHSGRGPGLEPIKLGQKINSFSVEARSSNSSVSEIKTQPRLGVNYIIALQGLFPSRN